MEGTSDKNNQQQDLISHHIFLLPFKWRKDDDSPYEIEHFKELTDEHLNVAQWKRILFDIDRISLYNEYHYFYDYVTEVLYETDRNTAPHESFIAHYEYKIAPGEGKYFITTPDPYAKVKDAKKTYELEIDSVLLHLYYTGVGVLSFHLNNRKPFQAGSEDILYINQYGRRVYPPFYFIPPKKVGYQLQFEEADFVSNLPSGEEIAHQIGIYLPNEHTEQYCVFENWQEPISKRLKTGEKFKFKLPAFLNPFLSHIENGYDIYPILDDRMFVVCWYGNNDLARGLTTKLPRKEQRFLNDPWWYRFTFVDGKYVTVQDEAMQKKLAEKATYTRWKKYGTLYGITEYSLVVLTSDLPTLRTKYSAYLVTHLQTIYYRLAELVLVQRASIQRFSDDITHISKIDGSDVRQAKLASLLNQRYIRFVNRIYFREVTAQVQGIEIYDKLQEQARVPQQVEALKEEIERLQVYIRQETDRQLLAAEKEREKREREQEQQRKIKEQEQERRIKEQERQEKARWDKLTLLGSVLVAPSLLLAAYGLSFAPSYLGDFKGLNYIITILAASISAGLSYWAFKKSRSRIWWISGIAYLMLLLLPNILCWISPSEAEVPTKEEMIILNDTSSLSVPNDSIFINDTLNTEK